MTDADGVEIVAVGPRFPIGYKRRNDRAGPARVAVGPRFPIGYKRKALLMREWPLRLARVSPSAIRDWWRMTRDN